MPSQRRRRRQIDLFSRERGEGNSSSSSSNNNNNSSSGSSNTPTSVDHHQPTGQAAAFPNTIGFTGLLRKEGVRENWKGGGKKKLAVEEGRKEFSLKRSRIRFGTTREDE